jgi:translation initiation factor IF-3
MADRRRLSNSWKLGLDFGRIARSPEYGRFSAAAVDCLAPSGRYYLPEWGSLRRGGQPRIALPKWKPLGPTGCGLRVSAFITPIERTTAIDRIQTRVNEQIRISPVRVISADGQQLGILPTDQALAKARETELDLVEVAPNERPPVCRIMDYGKYKYEKSKKTKSGAATHHTKTKEIRLRPKTGEHDIEFKVKQAQGFLKHKDKVQVSVIFRGREMAHIEEGRRVMQSVIEDLQEFGKVEVAPQQHGKRMVCTIAPK